MSIYKRKIAFILSIIMIFALSKGCASKKEEIVSETSHAAVDNSLVSSISSSSSTHIVIDTIGNEIEVSDEIDRVAIISTIPLASVFCMIEGSGDKLVGLTPASKNAAIHSFVSKIVTNMDNIDSSFASEGGVNVEQVAMLDPDVIFYNTNNEADSEAAKKLTSLGYPCVGFSTSVAGGDTIGTFAAWADLIGDVLGKENKAQEIVSYGDEILKKVQDRISSINDEDKKKILIVANYASDGTITAAGNTFGKYWITTIGGIHVASELEKPLSPVSLEQIYTWNPDIIFLNSFSAFTADDILDSTAVDGQDWSGIKAVEDGRVYKVPLGAYYWFPPCSDSPLALEWFAQKAYPELFEDIDIDSEIKDYYQRFYDITLTDDDLDILYNPPADSAMATN